MAESSTEQFTLTIKGGADTKLTVTVPSTATVGDLKEAVSGSSCTPHSSTAGSVSGALTHW